MTPVTAAAQPLQREELLRQAEAQRALADLFPHLKTDALRAIQDLFPMALPGSVQQSRPH